MCFDPKYQLGGILLEKLKKNVNLEESDKRIIGKLHKIVSKNRKIPGELVEELSKATSKGFKAWEEARERKDFKIFQPFLEKIVELKRKEDLIFCFQIFH